MNGLEAIELMKQGKTMMKYGGELYRIIDNNVRVQVAYGAPWEIEVSFDFFATYEEYRKKPTGWEKAPKEGAYCFIDEGGKLMRDVDQGCVQDQRIYDVANYFSTIEKAKQISFEQELFRKLQRFSDKNGGNEIDWSDDEAREYYIAYDYEDGDFYIGTTDLTDRRFGAVYFLEYRIAEEAIEVFKEDLIKYFTHDWSKGE